MSDIDDKLNHCLIALDDLRDLRLTDDIPKFFARFTGYANHVSAVRQYIQGALANLHSTTPHPEQHWMEALETNLDFGAVIALRHVDQHAALVRVHKKHISVALEEAFLVMEAGLSFVVKDAFGNVKAQGTSTPAIPKANHTPSAQTIEYAYFCEPAAIPEFMVANNAFPNGIGRIPNARSAALRKGDDLPNKLVVVAYLQSTDMLTVAERSYAVLTLAISDAHIKGYF